MLVGTYTALTVKDTVALSKRVAEVRRSVLIEDAESIIDFLDDLSKWLKRHQGHSFHIGSDYSIDGMDIDEYRNETLAGTVSALTRQEVALANYNEWNQSYILEIEGMVNECISGKRTVRSLAIELAARMGGAV